MKIKIINYFAISSFLIGVILLIVLIFQFSLSGYKFSINEINIEDSSKIVSIIQGLLSTIWLITTISLLFLTFFLQKEELQKTTTSFKIQNEDTHFFNLLNAFLSIRNNVEFSFYVEEFNSENAFPTLNEKT
ncbi:hypothetical protein [Leptospira wolbachii]|uniref:hypothetical protein n=1 Tax=Leptospira wolbachii TaxID=29511 RepID=UPI0012EC7561|nr:hypothetical protein [Leptospira wolbachii]